MSDKVIANERRRSHRAAGQGDYALHEAFLEAARERDDAHNEIERLRARIAKLEKVREAAEAWRADFALPVNHLRTARACLHLVAALDEVKV